MILFIVEHDIRSQFFVIFVIFGGKVSLFLESVSRKRYTAHTHTHTFDLSIPLNLVLGQDHVLRSEEDLPKVRRTPRRTDPLLVFAAVKKTAPSSREAIGPEVPDECIFLFRRHVAQWSRSSRCMLLFGVFWCWLVCHE